MGNNYIIRNAIAGDIPIIVSFLRKMMIEEMEASAGYPVSSDEEVWARFTEIIEENYRNKDHIYKLAEPANHKQVVGISEARVINRFIILKPARTLHIHSLYVEKGSRRTGIGKLLLDAILQWGREMKCEEAELDVFVNNSAIALYEQIGFRPFELKMVRKL